MVAAATARAREVPALPVTPIRGTGLHISISQVKTYLRCARQYELKYVKGIKPAFIPIALAFGSAFHAALAFYYGMIHELGTAPTVGETTQVFIDAWRNAADGPLPLQAEEDDACVDHEAKGAQMIAAFYTHAALTPVAVEAVEQGFGVELHDPDTGELLEETLVGAFDLVVLEGERYVIIEHKSAARRYSQDQLRYDVQPTAYKLAARHLGLGQVGVRFQVVTKTKMPAVQLADLVRGEHDEEDFMRTVVGVLRAIDAKAFYPVRGWQCRGCQFAHACAGAAP